MARVAGVNIPDKKQAWISLTHIFGIGRTTALKICETTGIKFDTKISALNEQELEIIKGYFESINIFIYYFIFAVVFI